MRRASGWRAGKLLVLAAGLALFAAGCTGKQGGQVSQAKIPPTKVPATPAPAGQDNGHVAIDLNCIADTMQKPQDSFHYTFKDSGGANPWEENADVSPTNISGWFKNASMSQPQKFQGTPQQVWHDLMAIGRLAVVFALVRNTSAVTRVGPETVNGYDAVKYGIDTAHGTAIEQGLFTSTMGPGGFAKGTVWARADGCPVKLEMVQEQHFKDGRAPLISHTEEDMVKVVKP